MNESGISVTPPKWSRATKSILPPLPQNPTSTCQHRSEVEEADDEGDEDGEEEEDEEEEEEDDNEEEDNNEADDNEEEDKEEEEDNNEADNNNNKHRVQERITFKEISWKYAKDNPNLISIFNHEIW